MNISSKPTSQDLQAPCMDGLVVNSFFSFFNHVLRVSCLVHAFHMTYVYRSEFSGILKGCQMLALLIFNGNTWSSQYLPQGIGANSFSCLLAVPWRLKLFHKDFFIMIFHLTKLGVDHTSWSKSCSSISAGSKEICRPGTELGSRCSKTMVFSDKVCKACLGLSLSGRQVRR